MLHDDPNAVISRLAVLGMWISGILGRAASAARIPAPRVRDRQARDSRAVDRLDQDRRRARLRSAGRDHRRDRRRADHPGARTSAPLCAAAERWTSGATRSPSRLATISWCASSISTSFAGPLLYLGGFESGILICGAIPFKGKTTLLRIAASSWGSGADGGSVRTWRTTANALEATLSSSNDTCCALDEIGQADGRDIGAIVYMIAGPSAKQRMRRDASIRSSYKWRLAGAVVRRDADRRPDRRGPEG